MTTLEEKPMTTAKPIVAAQPVLTSNEIKTMSAEETAASMRVLVYLARSDGSFSPEEKAVLQESMHGLMLPAGYTLDSLLNAQIDLDEELRHIASAEARDRTYNAAYGVAYSEGPVTKEKEALLDQIREGLHIDMERSTLTGRMFADVRDWVVPGTINPIADPVARETAVNESILHLSIASALVGAVSVPLLSVLADMIVVSIQVKMVRDIGQYWGHKVDKEAARGIMGSILGAAGVRIAVHSLMTVIPFFGAVVNAASSFGSTWALGKVANQYFASGGKLASDDLRKLYQEAKVGAADAYEKSKDKVAKAAGKK